MSKIEPGAAFSSVAEARTALCEEGYYNLHVRPGSPELWGKPGDTERYVIGVDSCGAAVVLNPEIFPWAL